MTQQEALFRYAVRMGDNSLVLGHRLSEWCGHGPQLEEDIAQANIALDLIGQARNYLTYAGEVEGKGRSEDDLAYLRTDREYLNVLLTELPKGDYAQTIARSFLFDAFHLPLQQALTTSTDERLKGIAEKAVKEVTYHLRHSSEWLIRFGDGTEESHSRVQTALDDLWRFTGELFIPDEAEELLAKAGIAPKLDDIKNEWSTTVDSVLKEATLERPADGWMATGGKKGVHSEHIGPMLAEMQTLQRTYPGVQW
ncbi:MAG: phenylacetate-CoA oxygenase subunit PaaC [Flavobacteriales bacterium]|nr:phenylacetate-CoA oxygenase subunit PaaC [Flavobacteriales bacterium]MBK7247882.1 phenylacetate-CoA oxygenase subunit PaaC [Flavobacteriales bacterium]MBK7287102.1 phenylacetate-CoA oxygenase subunit PaaC [Flavobacteriales bacterium]MBK9060275.1 phenylacetate-CoA oxygenase subunit PaaC [Flavobacteriales bacterium]MBK9598946.1 phenylacetate-CoA oxygenase subunit PaaC [Flavobacteriales bacterium]